MPGSFNHHNSSYRDPSGFIFTQDNILYRQVNKVFGEDFDFFISSGLYEKLVAKGDLIPHTVLPQNLTGDPQWHATIRPDQLSFISYPYEWSFGMLKDAALLTLELVREAISHGMILKDATPYNIQWHNGRLVFIDTLSFEKYDETKPWIAYRQFCEQFLSPLLLTHYSKLPLQQLLLAYPDGIPIAFTSEFLPWRSRLSVDTYLHIHLHARYSQKKPATQQRKPGSFSKKKLLTLITSLQSLINKLQLPPATSTWSAYYEEASQRNNYMEQKSAIINKWLTSSTKFETAADLGANTGEYAKLLAASGIKTIAADFDPYCINTLYKSLKPSGNNLLPLVIDLSLPTPAIGVNNKERQSFIERTNVDLVLALALIHHLAIGKNIPFEMIAEFFSTIGNYLVIEFVPKTDPKVQLMLQQKDDIYVNYSEENFEAAFATQYNVEDRQPIAATGRVLYLMKRK
ncbi:MAG TPA: hypothetical protein VFZ42_12345 [Chitinophagaceae bacterium]